MSPAIAIRLSDAGSAFLSLHHSLSPLPSSFLIFERYRKAAPSSDSPNPRLRRWALRSSTSEQIEWLTPHGCKGLSDELAKRAPTRIFVLAPATPWQELDDSAVKDTADVAEALRMGRYEVTLLIDGSLQEEERVELDKRIPANESFQEVAARQVFAAHLRAAARPGLAVDIAMNAPVWAGPLVMGLDCTQMSGFELLVSSRDVASQQEYLRSMQGKPGMIVRVTRRVPESGSMLSACDTLELRLGVGCDRVAADFVEGWISAGVAFLLEVGTVRLWCFWTRTGGEWCCRALRVPEMSNAVAEALDVARFRRQELGIECTERRLVPDVLGRLPEIRVDKLQRRDMPEEGKRLEDAAMVEDAIDALALLQGDARIGATKTVPVHGKKRVVPDETPPSHPSSEPSMATPVPAFRREALVSDGQDATCKFSDKAAVLPQPADDAKESKRDVEGPVPEQKRTKHVADATDSVRTGSTRTGHTISHRRTSSAEELAIRQKQFARRTNARRQAQVRPVKRVAYETAALPQRKRLRQAVPRNSSQTSRAYVERVTKMVLDSLEDAKPFFDHDRENRPTGGGGCPNDVQFQCVGDMHQCLDQDLAAGKGEFPEKGSHGVEYYKEGDSRDKKIMRLEQYLGKSALEFASAQGKLSKSQTGRLEEGITKLKEDGAAHRKQKLSHAHSQPVVTVADEAGESTDTCPDEAETPPTPFVARDQQHDAVRSKQVEVGAADAVVRTGTSGGERNISGIALVQTATRRELKDASAFRVEPKKSSPTNFEVKASIVTPVENTKQTIACAMSLADELSSVMERTIEHDPRARCEALTDVLVAELRPLSQEKRLELMQRVLQGVMQS